MKYLAAAALMIAAANVNAGFYTGNELKSKCEEAVGTINHSYCMGYVSGVHDSAYGYVCTPPKFSIGQAVAIVLKFWNDNPEKLHLSADVTVHRALSQAFPCLEK